MIQALFSVSNPLHPDIWPSVMKFEAEIISMTAGILNGGDEAVTGTLSSGGTESILLAAKAHREWGREVKGISNPEVIACTTAHAAIDKACELLGMTLVRVPADALTQKISLSHVKSALTSDTVLIYSSAPNYPSGIIDPIEAPSLTFTLTPKPRHRPLVPTLSEAPIEGSFTHRRKAQRRSPCRLLSRGLRLTFCQKTSEEYSQVRFRASRGHVDVL